MNSVLPKYLTVSLLFLIVFSCGNRVYKGNYWRETPNDFFNEGIQFMPKDSIQLVKYWHPDWVLGNEPYFSIGTVNRLVLGAKIRFKPFPYLRTEYTHQLEIGNDYQSRDSFKITFTDYFDHFQCLNASNEIIIDSRILSFDGFVLSNEITKIKLFGITVRAGSFLIDCHSLHGKENNFTFDDKCLVRSMDTTMNIKPIGFGRIRTGKGKHAVLKIYRPMRSSKTN
ncbi:MAG: hypothetical protein KDC92_10600 [Bacteroidetes bacterium]|nr:hypothetical protein [Bacteroidota bacterium]